MVRIIPTGKGNFDVCSKISASRSYAKIDIVTMWTTIICEWQNLVNLCFHSCSLPQPVQHPWEAEADPPRSPRRHPEPAPVVPAIWSNGRPPPRLLLPGIAPLEPDPVVCGVSTPTILPESKCKYLLATSDAIQVDLDLARNYRQVFIFRTFDYSESLKSENSS